jgi:UDP-N-acetylmuramoylalanine-D-glutamate ligase
MNVKAAGDTHCPKVTGTDTKPHTTPFLLRVLRDEFLKFILAGNAL